MKSDNQGITPEHLRNIGFEPRPFQKNVFYELAKDPKKVNMLRPRRFHYGIDIAEGKDKSVITRAKINSKGQVTRIYFDEFAEMPNWKWYRNPIKWWKWRKLWKTIERDYERTK